MAKSLGADRAFTNRRMRWAVYMVVGAFVVSGLLQDEFHALAIWLSPYFPFVDLQLNKHNHRGDRTAAFFAAILLCFPVMVALIVSGIWRAGRSDRLGSFRQRFRGEHPAKFALILAMGLLVSAAFIWAIWASPLPVTNQRGDSFLRWMLGSDVGLLAIGGFIALAAALGTAMAIFTICLPLDLFMHLKRERKLN